MPPQAYTKETLQEAFEWWSQQPDELRSQIQDKDDLVGYYLRVNRGVDSAGKQEGFTKSAKESFSTELKGLAKNLDTFEGYEEDQHKAVKNRPAKVYLQQPAERHKQVFEPSIQLQFPEMSKPLVPSVEESDAAVVSAPLGGAVVPTGKASTSNQFFRLDEKSKASVAKVKSLLNLSSDEEALRAVIALGAAKIKNLT